MRILSTSTAPSVIVNEHDPLPLPAGWISLAPLPPNVLQFGQNITISFSYNTTEPGGVRIWARPMSTTPSGDVLTPNYAACGSPICVTLLGAVWLCPSEATSVNITAGTAIRVLRSVGVVIEVPFQSSSTRWEAGCSLRTVHCS
jgi:hypothetical protein